MYAVSSPSDTDTPPAEIVPLRRWADGAAEIGFAQSGAETRLSHLYQSDPCRVLFPKHVADAPKEAVIVTTSGGVVGADRLRFEIAAGPQTVATVTTQAAEKIYRAAGAESEIDVTVRADGCGFLEWMPQETILFDGARLRRKTLIEISGDARLLTGEIVVFGRRARDETYTNGLLHDAWRIRRDGGLIWADALHLSGDISSTISNRHAFNGAAAVATLVYFASDAPEMLMCARDLTDAMSFTMVDDILIGRMANSDAANLRREYARFWRQFRSEAAGLKCGLPRVWEV